jgi:hypothetical protein
MRDGSTFVYVRSFHNPVLPYVTPCKVTSLFPFTETGKSPIVKVSSVSALMP